MSWLRWLAVLALPFVAVFGDTWLNTERIKRDYRANELTTRKSRLREELDALRDRKAELTNMDRIDTEADGIGLEPPRPGQIRRIGRTRSANAVGDGAALGDGAPYPPVGCLVSERPSEASQPEAAAADEGRRAPGRHGDASWDSSGSSNRTRATSVTARLRQAIAAAWALYSSPS